MNLRIKTLTLITLGASILSVAYIVKKGDTLWDLSDEHLQDPFVWPDLWSQNTHIQDPHWIYPGDSLYIPGLDGAATQTSAPEVDEKDTTLPKGIRSTAAKDSRREEFTIKLGSLPGKAKATTDPNQAEKTDYVFNQQASVPVFNRYYQVMAPILTSFAKMNEQGFWFSVKSGEKKPAILLKTGDEVLLSNRPKHTFTSQELVELWLVQKVAVPQYKKADSERIVTRLAGFARVQAVGDSLTRMHITQMFSSVKIEDLRAKKSFNLQPIQVQGYTPVPEVKFEAMAEVYYALDSKLAVGPYSYIMVNQGVKQGFTSGNGVAIWEHEIVDPGLPPRLLGRGIVVSSNQEESCILVRELYSPSRRVAVGNRISLTHKAVLK